MALPEVTGFNAIAKVAFLSALLLYGASAEAGVLGKHKLRTVILGGVIVGGAVLLSKHKQHKNSQNELGESSTSGSGGGYEADESAADPDLMEKSSNNRKLKSALNQERVSLGMPPDPDDCDAHHIVPRNDGRKGIKEFADDARAALDGCVDIDSAVNGIYLPKNQNSNGCEGAYHQPIHNKDYYQPLANRLKKAKQYGGCDEVVNELKIIKDGLSKGVLP